MPDIASVFLDFFPNFALLIALTYIYGLILSRLREVSENARGLLDGLLFALIAAIGMNLPISVAEGISIDGRNVIVMLAAPYGGIAAGILAGLATAAYRLYLGGIGAWAGAAAILTAATFGIAYRYRFRREPSHIKPAHLALLALIMTGASLLWTFALPASVPVLEILQRISLPFAVMNMAIAVVLGLMLTHEYRRLELVTELQEKERRLESSQRLANMGDFIWDIDSGEVTWSKGLYELVGYDPDEKIDFAKVSAELHHPEDLDRVNEWLAAGIKAGKPDLGRNSYRLMHRDGSVIHVTVQGRFEMANGKPVKLIGTCIDMSDTLRATAEIAASRDEAERANRTKSEFLASMSHELRTPLNAVLGYGQMLRLNREDNLTEAQLAYVDNILAGGQHLLELVNDILDLAKIEADRLSVHPEELATEEIVAECIADLQLAAEQKGVSVEDKVSEAPLRPLLTDKLRFRQITTNLLSNAIKYNKDGGKVTLSAVETDDNFLRLSVTDTGIGIAKDKHDELFQLFHRVVDDPRVAAEGMGIGLAVSKMLAHRLGGHIGFESVEGEGSTFWVDLPLACNKAVLIWTDDLRVGVDPIDKDHQIIFSLTNKVSRSDLDTGDMAAVVEEMIAYTRYHFRREEVIMQICGYPDLNAHKQHHRKLEQQINDIAMDWRQRGAPETLLELRTFLRDWWRDHILNVDRTIARYTEGRENDIRAALAEVV